MSTSSLEKSFIEIYDIEVIRNCFLYLGIDTKSNQIIEFVIFGARNDLREFCKHLRSLKGQIGFNNLNYDSQVCQFILNNESMWLELEYTADQITEEVFKFSQETINRSDVGFPVYSEYKLYTKQLDLYKMHHFDNRAKVQSLKGLQCNLNWRMCQEMPIDFNSRITEAQLQMVIDYCRNDILSTQRFYDDKKSKEEIETRKGLAKSYGFDHRIMNWSNSKIGAELVLKFYCEHTGKNPKDVRKERTMRDEIALKDCIPDYIKFRTPEFNALLDKFKSTILYEHNKFKFGATRSASETLKKAKNKRKEAISVLFKNYLELDYGIGGLHGALSGLFESTDEWLLYDIDVASLYPSIAIANKLYPEQLGPEFVDIYAEKIVNVRLREKAKGKKLANKAIVSGLKEAANSVYGKSSDKYSFIYDPKYTFSTTAIGELTISMLIETFGEDLNCKVIYSNTDSVTLFVHKDSITKFQQICHDWEKLTGLKLEGYCNRGNEKEVIYRKQFIRDVNNYCAITQDGEIKLKGCFEKDKLLHKDPSARIVTIALEEYVVNGKSVEETINNHSSIWDFLIRRKFKKNSSTGEYSYWKNGKLIIEPAQKVARYYVANKATGKDFVKVYTSGKKQVVEKGWKSMDANLIESENAFDYDICRRYYIERTYKIIDAVIANRVQLSLF